MFLTMNELQEQITNEFRSGYLYMTMSENNTKYSELAKEKIESGMEIFELLMAANQSCER